MKRMTSNRQTEKGTHCFSKDVAEGPTVAGKMPFLVAENSFHN